MSIWESNKPLIGLAPMDDVTDVVFRGIIDSCVAADFYVSEFASVDGLQSPGRSRVMNKLRKHDSEKTLIAQIWGLKPDNYTATAREISEMGFVGLDINMGCPTPKIVKNGACSALINNRQLAKEIIEATKTGTSLPVSVKTRIGFNKIDLTWIEFLLQQDIAALTVHGRTTKEMSKVDIHWDQYEEIAALRDEYAPQTKILINGDLTSRNHAEEMVEKYGFDGAMLGRAVFRDPYVFSSNSPWPEMTKEKKLEIYKRHIKNYMNEWGEDKNPAVLKRFAKVYVNGFDGASDLRTRLMEEDAGEGLLDVLDTSK